MNKNVRRILELADENECGRRQWYIGQRGSLVCESGQWFFTWRDPPKPGYDRREICICDFDHDMLNIIFHGLLYKGTK